LIGHLNHLKAAGAFSHRWFWWTVTWRQPLGEWPQTNV